MVYQLSATASGCLSGPVLATHTFPPPPGSAQILLAGRGSNVGFLFIPKEKTFIHGFASQSNRERESSFTCWFIPHMAAKARACQGPTWESGAASPAATRRAASWTTCYCFSQGAGLGRSSQGTNQCPCGISALTDSGFYCFPRCWPLVWAFSPTLSPGSWSS